jgi:hypothetical protein
LEQMTTFKLEEISKLEQITNWNEFQILKSSDYSIKKENRKEKRQKGENPKKIKKNGSTGWPISWLGASAVYGAPDQIPIGRRIGFSCS